MTYLAYATWCRNLGIEPATEERWNKLRDRQPYPDKDADRHRSKRATKRVEDLDVAEFMNQPIGARLAWWERYQRGGD